MSKVDVHFVEGFDNYTTYPNLVRDAGLDQRFAVIQDTYVPGSPDMVFDQPLWLALLEFVIGYAPEGILTVRPWQDRRPDQTLEEFKTEWEAELSEDREPPEALYLRVDGRLVLGLVTAPWKSIGGPDLYHDSYTYSLFSTAHLGPQIQEHLRQANLSGQWALSDEVVQVSVTPSVVLDWLQKAFSLDWLKRGPKV